MRANELMLGDWVLYNPNVFIEDEYELPKDCYPTKISCGEDIDLAIEDCYSPIPLTEEILEKNGFKCEEIIQRHWISEGGRILLKNDESLISSNNKWSVHVDNEDMQSIGYFEITYVHELQHALRLCNIDIEIKV